MLSVVCPIYNEEKYIAKCIDSILAQDYPKEDLEIILVDGISTDRTRDIVEEYLRIYPFIILLDNPKRIAPCAMNIGIKASKGDVIIRLDAHATYPTNYFSTLVKYLHELNADNVGCICETKSVKQTPEAIAIAKVMSDKFGVGNSKFRVGTTEEYLEADTVPFGCFKRSVFDKVGYYNEYLIRGQDIELNKRIKRAGGKIVLISSIKCTYIPRDNYADFFRNRYLTGLWVIKSCFILKRMNNSGIRHFIPALFFLSIVLPLLATIIFKYSCLLSFAVLLVYLALILYRSIKICPKGTHVWAMLKAFACLHFGYSLGSMKGLLIGLFMRKHLTE